MAVLLESVLDRLNTLEGQVERMRLNASLSSGRHGDAWRPNAGREKAAEAPHLQGEGGGAKLSDVNVVHAKGMIKYIFII